MMFTPPTLNYTCGQVLWPPARVATPERRKRNTERSIEEGPGTVEVAAQGRKEERKRNGNDRDPDLHQLPEKETKGKRFQKTKVFVSLKSRVVPNSPFFRQILVLCITLWEQTLVKIDFQKMSKWQSWHYSMLYKSR